MLAAGIWYVQQNRPERSAHIFRIAYQKYEQTWFLDLHKDAYALTTPDSIESEVSLTQHYLRNRYSQNNAFALLIGIQDYKKESGFDQLKTPLNDIRR